MNRFQFVEDHKDAYGVKRLCEVVEIGRSSFYAWLAAAPARAARAAEDAALAERIRVLQDPAQGGDRAYGAPRITADLNDGVPGIGHVLTAVLLAEIGEDRARFPQPEVLLAEAGLAPVTRSSGRSRSVRFR